MRDHLEFCRAIERSASATREASRRELAAIMAPKKFSLGHGPAAQAVPVVSVDLPPVLRRKHVMTDEQLAREKRYSVAMEDAIDALGLSWVRTSEDSEAHQAAFAAAEASLARRNILPTNA
jgi:hypothetical protein